MATEQQLNDFTAIVGVPVGDFRAYFMTYYGYDTTLSDDDIMALVLETHGDEDKDPETWAKDMMVRQASKSTAPAA